MEASEYVLHADMELDCDADNPVTDDHVPCTFLVYVATDDPESDYEGGMLPPIKTFVLKCSRHGDTFVITGHDLKCVATAVITINAPQEKL